MKKRPRVAIDVNGGDSSDVTHRAALEAAAKAPSIQVVAYGNRAKIQRVAEASHQSYGLGKLEIIDCSNHTTEMRAIAHALAGGSIDAWVTPAKSPRLLAALRYAGLLEEGLVTPALMAPLPTDNVAGHGGLSFLMDVGLTGAVDTGEVFVQWAEYGSRFLKMHYGIESPRIALYNIATERAAPSLQLINEALKVVPGYISYAEPQAVVDGKVDLWLAEGLIGNGLIKALESWLRLASVRLLKRFAQDGNEKATKATTVVFGRGMSYDAALISPVIGLKGDLVVCRAHGAATDKQIAGGIAAVQRYLG